jgi:hypothetical protein
MADLISAARMISDFGGSNLTIRVAELERIFRGANSSTVNTLCSSNGVGAGLLSSASTLKKTAGQIHVIVHCVGVLLLLPYILKDNEAIESLSLGAAGTGKTGKAFDLETNSRIAEFKFIQWRNKGNAGREHSLFKDFYDLAESDIDKDRYLYVVGEEQPLKFLTSGQAIESVLSHNNKVWTHFRERYVNRFTKVNEYYEYRKQRVKLVDITKMAPDLEGLLSQIDIVD